jgi:putative tricarboxylic transport membrane protein
LNRQVMIEGLVVFGLGILSIIEGIRLTVMERIQMYDVLGPGKYNVGVGILLIIVSLVYLASFRQERKDKKETDEADIQKNQYRKKMVAMFAILAVYITLIYFVGYLLATLIFFLLINRVVGFRPWLLNGGMSIGISVAFYLVFVHELDMIFPKGVFLEWIWGENF